MRKPSKYKLTLSFVHLHPLEQQGGCCAVLSRALLPCCAVLCCVVGSNGTCTRTLPFFCCPLACLLIHSFSCSMARTSADCCASSDRRRTVLLSSHAE